MEALLGEGNTLVLLAHTPQDVGMAHRILSHIDTLHARTRVIVSPYCAVSPAGLEAMVPYYNLCGCVVSMRFHGNVLGMVLGRPVVALAGHPQIEGLFSELGLSGAMVKVDGQGFEGRLLEAVGSAFCSESVILRQNAVLSGLEQKSTAYFAAVRRFVEQGKR